MQGQLDLWGEFKKLGGFPKERSKAKENLKRAYYFMKAFDVYYSKVKFEGSHLLRICHN